MYTIGSTKWMTLANSLLVYLINLWSTSFTDVGYGNQVRLVIRGKVNLKDIKFQSFATPMMTGRQADVAINKVSIAKN